MCHSPLLNDVIKSFYSVKNADAFEMSSNILKFLEAELNKQQRYLGHDRHNLTIQGIKVFVCEHQLCLKILEGNIEWDKVAELYA